MRLLAGILPELHPANYDLLHRVAGCRVKEQDLFGVASELHELAPMLNHLARAPLIWHPTENHMQRVAPSFKLVDERSWAAARDGVEYSEDGTAREVESDQLRMQPPRPHVPVPEPAPIRWAFNDHVSDPRKVAHRHSRQSLNVERAHRD